MPTAPCSLLLEQAEWEVLYCTIHRVATPSKEVPSLHQAVRWIGQLGGYLGRKGDREPGVTTMWRGLHRLVDLATMCQIMRFSSPTINVRKD
ncbi:MAG: IS4 family transposase [Chloroflexia bacterium]